MRWVGNILLLVASLFLSLVVVAALLEVLPNRFAQARDSQRGKRPDVVRIYHLNRETGIHSLKPTPSAGASGACFATRDIVINELGFRGALPDGGYPAQGVALLGDSFIEAMQVPYGLGVGELLADALDEPVLNTGVGGYSTVTELAAYRTFVASLRPRITIMFTYLGNDIRGNSCRLSAITGVCGRHGAGDWVMVNPIESPEAAGAKLQGVSKGQLQSADDTRDFVSFLRAWGRDNLAFYHALSALKVLVKGVLAPALDASLPLKLQLYLPADKTPEPEAWQEAWAVTRGALRDLRDDVARNGGHLLVVAIPEHIAIDPNWRDRLRFDAGVQVPDSMDPERPMQRFRRLTADLGLPLVDLTTVFAAYRDAHDLTYPYFAFRCDGHWNPLGHRLAAAAVLDRLASEGWIAAESPLEKVLQTAPETLIGKAAYDAVFRGGVYSP